MGGCAQINVCELINLLMGNLWPLVVYLMCESQTVEMHSNYLETFAWSGGFHCKICNIMDPTNWGPRSERVIANFTLHLSVL